MTSLVGLLEDIAWDARAAIEKAEDYEKSFDQYEERIDQLKDEIYELKLENKELKDELSKRDNT